MIHPRHTLVFIAPEARAALADRLAAGLLPQFRRPPLQAWATAAFVDDDIPGIACRPDGAVPAGHVALGVAFPFRHEGSRVRARIDVPAAAVAGAWSPYEVLALPRPRSLPFGPVLDELLDAAAYHGAELGVFGSTALQLATRLGYVEAISDLDLVVRAPGAAALAGFAAASAAIARRHALRLDAEVDLANGYGVKLAELLSGANTVLGRSLADVRLLDRDEALRAVGSGRDPAAARTPMRPLERQPGV
ncbi:malonate decarboxylase holo-[acyl-carrier-protein] synthase [Rhodoplanes sp. TEM]|uniref:Malonate decarboxylase holo-[acyl-carrier-protein] synthase n=1 Tax=Rhodoplanes tepidamans TaxID=200616 RepID=A0ABT5J7H2_RHOTP|nr:MULTISPECIES: malonate decarboxylase holo-[acyl-carrier-protein] synthase [Rhodoplanes]MDC7784970.1 malonate decarboxylase holo-[acyl-carrier-protein] synthase [Rhodoplanes tepidamans]MDC7985838.1 malonate decarboxylase holo-[acyl-carrier-protein] synthase [Rhodoplanes sp. TEM]MDQ0353801.1 phosphoribosyl-dephospho-CoA transferase [Rhodoplanes tepidamans]